MNKDSHTGKGYGRPEEEPPDHPSVFEEISKTDRDEVRYHPDEASSEAYDDEEGRGGRNWAILLTLFSVIVVQLAGIALIVWAVFW